MAVENIRGTLTGLPCISWREQPRLDALEWDFGSAFYPLPSRHLRQRIRDPACEL